MKTRVFPIILTLFGGLGALPACGGGGGNDGSAQKARVELCNNGVDDTGNGLADCDDPACDGNAACGAGIPGILPNCGNNRLDSGETCDGLITGSATCASVGNFDGGALACRSDCTGYDTSACTAPGGDCGNDVLDEGEVCDGSALDGASCQSLGYENGGALGCAVNCQRYDVNACSSAAVCGNDVREGPEACDGADLGSASCVTAGFTGGQLGCTARCTFDTAQCESAQVCGNDAAEGDEVCDGTDVGGATCVSEGFAGGTLGCNADCDAYDTSACQAANACNNGTIDADEVCDGTLLGGETCQTLGYKSGALACGEGCTRFDTSACFGYPNCGNGVADGLDACDGAAWDAGPSPACSNFGLGTGTVSCTAECGLDFSTCQATDYCEAQGWYNDGVCDACQAYGGTPDPDCETICGARDQTCSNWYDEFAHVYVCDAAGIRDPDCGVCGNAQREGAELCDGNQFRTNRQTCADYDFSGGTLGCRDDCTPDFSGCQAVSCGDGQIEGNEVCDGSNFGGVSCQSLGYGTGTLRCLDSCGTVDTSDCSGTLSYANGALDAQEWCDGPSGPFLYGSNSCASFGLGDGNILCGPDGIDFSQCEIWPNDAAAPVSADYCEIKGWYSDGQFCDPCELLGGNPDPDCASLCGADGVCADIYSYATRGYTCPQPDPDCGTCGNGVVQGYEQCDGTSFNSTIATSCEANGFVGGTVSCRDDCTLNLGNCQPATCGNGTVEGNEVCDGGSVSCTSLGHKTGTATCKSDCTGYDISACQGLASCGNGRVDSPSFSVELCDGNEFRTFGGGASAGSCSTFNLGSGSVGCTSRCELDFSGCSGTDLCAQYGMRGDGQCDLCELYGGGPDPDCDPGSASFACGFDGVCNDYFDTYTQLWPCREKGFQDPDCGFCGNGVREEGEYCDGGSNGTATCADYGYTGGVLRCTADCTADLRDCTLGAATLGSSPPR